MKISLIVKYAKLPDDVKTPEALSRFLIIESVARRYPQGMPRTESRMYAKLLDQFYEEKTTIDVDEQTFLLIKESLDQSTLPAHMSSWKWALLDHLEKCAEKKKDG